MFSTFYINTWYAATMVAFVAGTIGFFAVIRGSAFPAHALPQGAFAGAAGASLIGVNTILGLGVFALLGAIGIGVLGDRERHDVATALTFVLMLGLGAFFLSLTTEYAPEIYSLLFGEILGVAHSELLPIALIGVVCLAAITILYRPMLHSSFSPELAEVNGTSRRRIDLAFLIILGLVTTMTVPVVGALLMFSLTIAPAATARQFTARPALALALSILIALATVWTAIAISYETNYPIGFFVGAIGTTSYTLVKTVKGAYRRYASGRHVMTAAPAATT
ncbi:MAG TPA: metal ABC transporter permease [Mycobacteriales bacterium]|nr:metal ABC transporter permease [Mycobacteriales bacterium]